MAPEYVRRWSEYTTPCDIYSLAMIIYEIYAREGPFEDDDPRKILPKVCHPRYNQWPQIPDACPPSMADLIKKWWRANAFSRPCVKDIDYVLAEMNSRDTEPWETDTEHICNMKRSIFPKHIANALHAGKKLDAESHEIMTVVFSGTVGCTSISNQFTPLKFPICYIVCIKHLIILQVLIVSSSKDHKWCIHRSDQSWRCKHDTHVKQAAEYAQGVIRAASQILIDEEDPSKGYVQIRVGFHSGPVVPNVIKSLNPRYGLYGDSVDTASRLESNSMPATIHCSHASEQLLQTQSPDIPLTLRGMIKIKGKGKMKTFLVGGDDLVESTLLVPQLMDPELERTWFMMKYKRIFQICRIWLTTLFHATFRWRASRIISSRFTRDRSHSRPRFGWMVA